MSTPDMAAYLLERIAEDERIALDASALRDDWPWTSGRVLAECEAKRRVVQHCLEVLTHHVYGDWGATDMAEEVLQRLVGAYADRPDFPPEWPSEVAG